jgi:hypothetical protein
MTDRTTKILLGLIAAGLSANFATSFLQPATAQSEVDLWMIESTVDDIESTVDGIESTVDDVEDTVNRIENTVDGVAYGTCINSKIC